MQEPENDICVSTLPAIPAPKFLPQWRGPVEGYAKNQIQKLLPRVKYFVEYDDLLQEAFEVYLFCRCRYTRVDNGAWFMALFKRVLYSRYARLVGAAAQWSKIDEFGEIHEGLLVEWCDGLLQTACNIEGLLPLIHLRTVHTSE